MKRCVLGFFKDLFSHLQLQFSLQGLFNLFFTACELNEASTFDYPHGVTIRNGCEWGNSLNYFTKFLPFVCVCVCVVAKGDSEKDKNTKMGLYNRGLLKNLIKPRPRELNY